MAKRFWTHGASVGAGAVVSAFVIGASPVHADGNLQNVKHIIIMMQENRSFDNYFGVLPFVPDTPYHSARGRGDTARARPPTTPASTVSPAR